MIKLSPKRRKYLIVIIPGGIVGLPISLYLASAEIKYHPYWHSFIVSYVGFWFIVSAGIWFYFYAISLKNAIKSRRKEQS
ncbi:MAG: hypothetical protein ACYCSO_02775 [Cuniculiplasma sp.]